MAGSELEQIEENGSEIVSKPRSKNLKSDAPRAGRSKKPKDKSIDIGMPEGIAFALALGFLWLNWISTVISQPENISRFATSGIVVFFVHMIVQVMIAVVWRARHGEGLFDFSASRSVLTYSFILALVWPVILLLPGATVHNYSPLSSPGEGARATFWYAELLGLLACAIIQAFGWLVLMPLLWIASPLLPKSILGRGTLTGKRHEDPWVKSLVGVEILSVVLFAVCVSWSSGFTSWSDSRRVDTAVLLGRWVTGAGDPIPTVLAWIALALVVVLPFVYLRAARGKGGGLSRDS